MAEAQTTTEAALEPIYVASRASIPERGAMWRQLRAEGVPITSSWIDEDGEGDTASFVDLWDRIHKEIAAAAALVLYAERDDFPLKGALIEAGIALGMGKPVIVCLPDLGELPRNYRPVGSWIAHPLISRRDEIRRAVELATCSRVSASVAPAVDQQTIYADGYCARCSELTYPLTKALEKIGVPTGADNWQQTHGPNKVRALADLETCLRRLLFALEKGDAKEIEDRIQRANHYIEFHAAIRRRLTALAQQNDEHAAALVSTVALAESPILAFESWLLRWVADNGRKLTQTEYGIAYAAFIAAHPGEGPKSHVMATSPIAHSAPWRDEGGHAWERCTNIECVECPHCCFTFAAVHGDSNGYSCPNCQGCPDAVSPADRDEADTSRIQRLAAQLNGVMNSLATSQREVERLRAGSFTPQEFQNLCHNFDEKDREVFVAGCIEYQKKLFGESATPLPSTRIRAAAEEIHKLCDEMAPDIPNDSTSYAPTVGQITTIIERYCFSAEEEDQKGSTE